MKLGLMSACFCDKTWDEACRLAKEAGLQAIESPTGGLDGSYHCRPVEMSKDDDAIKAFADSATKRGLEISSFSCKGNPVHPDSRIAGEYIADLEASMYIAQKTGVKSISVFAGLPGAAEDAKYPNWIVHPWPFFFTEALKWQWDKKVIPFWIEMSKKAKKLGVKFAFEMEPGDVVYNPETLLKLREAVGTEEIACNLDPGHLFYQGIDIETAIRRLGDMIVHVHVKDAVISKHVVDFTGIIDAKMFSDMKGRAWNYATVGYGHDMQFWKNFVSVLRITGYEGVLSIENENTNMSAREGLSKSIEFLKQCMLFDPAGKQWWDEFMH